MTYPDNYIFFRSQGDVNPTIERAEGIHCYDADGNRYIDGMGGVGVVSIGHGVAEIKEAVVQQMEKVCFAHPFHWKNKPHMELTARIVNMAPDGMSKVFLTSGGSEATETALKMARQYFVEKGMPSKYKVISRWSSFHGNTIGALSMSGMSLRRKGFTPLLLDFPHIPQCHCYRCPFDREYPACNIACASELEKVILREGAENIAAFIAEPIVGAANGGVGAPPEYFEMVREICDRYDVLMIMDEVITGFGRTGMNFGINHWDVIPDIICTGKGMSSGYTPLGAVIVHERVIELFENSPSGFSHGYTYGGNPLSCAIGSAVLAYMEKNQLIKNVAELSPHFFEQAEKLADLDVVGEVRGKGFFLGIELVMDKKSKQPFPAGSNISTKVADIAFRNGLITGAGSGGIDGVRGNHIVLAPPYICTRSDLDEIVSILEQSIREAARDMQV